MGPGGQEVVGIVPASLPPFFHQLEMKAMSSSSPNYWVSQGEDKQWHLRREGAERASGVFGTQGEAAARGRDLAKQSHGELIIKGRNNRIRSKDSYGNDPLPPRDTEH